MRLAWSVLLDSAWLAYFAWTFWRYPTLTHEQVNHAHAFLFLEGFAITLMPLALFCLLKLGRALRERRRWDSAGWLSLFAATSGLAIFAAASLSLWRGGGWLGMAVALLLGTRLVELLFAGRRPLRAAARLLGYCAFPALLVNLMVPFAEFPFVGAESAMHLMLVQGGVVYHFGLLLFHLSERPGQRWLNPFHPRGRTRRVLAGLLVLLVVVVALRSDGYRLSKAEQEARRKTRARPTRSQYLGQEWTAGLTMLLALLGAGCLARGAELANRARAGSVDPSVGITRGQRMRSGL